MDVIVFLLVGGGLLIVLAVGAMFLWKMFRKKTQVGPTSVTTNSGEKQNL